MAKVDKQTTGFKFGINPTKLIRSCGEFVGNQGKHYRLVVVEADGRPYYSIRLYNHKGRFLKQLMFDLDSIHALYGLLYREREKVTTGALKVAELATKITLTGKEKAEELDRAKEEQK